MLFPKPIILDKFALSIFNHFYIHPSMDTTRHECIIGCHDHVDDSIDQSDPRDPLLYRPDSSTIPTSQPIQVLTKSEASRLSTIHSQCQAVFNDRVDEPALFDAFGIEIEPEKAHLLIPHEPRRASLAIRVQAVEQHSQKNSEGIFARPWSCPHDFSSSLRQAKRYTKSESSR